RAAGDRYLLVEYGSLVLDLRLRFRAHALMLWLEEQKLDGVIELTPGIRSLQIHFDPMRLPRHALLKTLADAEHALQQQDDLEVPSRIVHIPLSWDDEACHQAIEKYMQSVRKDAPWCPSNLEFIRRINGLDNVDEVKKILFSASYVVMGLGDVYLGAPVATPYDPRHRLVTTKYNPARTWTAENSVGIGGAYLCVYGMEGPGGYQFVGRTLQMWNRYRQTEAFDQPWLLRFFDQIRFYEVSHEELKQIRRDFPKGQYPIQVEETTFSLNAYQQFLDDNQQDIATFTDARNRAFDQELQRWVESGQINFQSEQDLDADNGADDVQGTPVESPVAGSIW
ncbi:carboxyltransferase domain-containing protein, partial [Alcanivorax sp. HI0044]